MGSMKPRQRFRSKTKSLDPPSLSFDHVLSFPGHHVSVPRNATGLKIDDFHDVVGNIASWQNPCMHFRAVGGLRPLHDVYDGLGNVALECDNRPFLDRDLLLASIPQPSSAQLADFSLYARQRSISAVDEGPMILAFLGELLESLEKIITKLVLGKGMAAKIAARFESEFRRLVAKAGGTVSGDWRSQLSQWPSQAWLAWNFAIKPFIGDLQKLFTSLGHASKRLEWLKRRNCKPTKISTRRKFSITDIPFVGPQEQMYVDAISIGGGASVLAFGAGVRYECTQVEWTLVTQNCVRFTIPPYLLEGPGAMPYVWANYVGLTNPIKSLWELVPFSWLLEWFLGYKTLLQKELTNFTTLADAEHLGAVSSMKAKAFVTVTQIDGHGGEIPLGDVRVEWYTRIGSEFDSESAPAFQWPFGWYQFSILGSLVLQWWQKR